MVQIAKSSADRGGYRLTSEMLLPAPRQEVFKLFSDAFELERLTPPWLNFSVITPSPIEMHEGTLIDYRLRLHGIPLRWQSRIECWDPPFQFNDVQVRGPYRFWEHLHTFEEENGSTRCRDQVDYAFWGGALIHNLFVKRDLMKIFSYRTQILRQLFGHSSALPKATLVSN